MKKQWSQCLFYVGSLLALAMCLQIQAETPSELSFTGWKSQFKQKALAAGLSQHILNSTLASIKLNPKVLELDSSQPEFSKPIWDYLDRATAKNRVKKGINLINQHRHLLENIEQRYAVPKEIIVAIWAMESEFGENYGHNNIIRSLATLAFHGKRAEFAERELLAALLIYQNRKANNKKIHLCYAHNLKQTLIGSWAGAMGQAQFMPSSYLKYAVDYDRDARLDLWDSLPDVFASIANYLKESGWSLQQKHPQDWMWEVTLAKKFNWALNTSETFLSLPQWQESGVKFLSATPDTKDMTARLFIPAGKSGPVFLMSKNFEVIRSYNKSSSYALAVAQLSRLFSGGKAIQTPWPREDKPLSFHQKKELQLLLGAAGFDTGKIDGKIGENSKRAIHDWQLKQGLPGDGYANSALLKRLKQVVQKALLK